MTYLCLIIDAHQPIKLNKAFPYERAKRLAEGSSLIDRYFDEKLDQEVFTTLSKRCYRPVFETVLAMILGSRNIHRPFKLALNFSSPFLEQAVRYDPDLLNLVKKLIDTKMVELLSGTHFHSLASLYPTDRNEFIEQVKTHREYVKKLFTVESKVFANTGYIYNDAVGKSVEEMGFEGLLTEGVDRALGDRPPNYVYCSRGANGLKILLRHHRLADDISIRFFQRNWSEYPLTAEKYANWLSSTGGDVITIALDIETLREDQPSFKGILEFLKHLPIETASRGNLEWATPSEALRGCPASGVILIPETETISWAGEKKDTAFWLSNAMQRISFDRMASLKPYVNEVNDNGITKIWRLLQQSDHIEYMAMEKEELGGDHSSYNPYSSPAEAYAVFDSIFTDFEGKVATIVQRIRRAKVQPPPTLQPTRPPVSTSVSYPRHSGY